MSLEVSYQNHFLHTIFLLLDLNWEKLPTLYFLRVVSLFIKLSGIASFEIEFLSRCWKGQHIIDNDIIAMKLITSQRAL